MRLVPSNVAGARDSRFPRRKRGINSQASALRRRSRRWYLAFKSELFTLFPTSRHSPPSTYGISAEKGRSKENEKEGKEKGTESKKERETSHTCIYPTKGRRPRRAKNLGFVFNPLFLTPSCRL